MESEPRSLKIVLPGERVISKKNSKVVGRNRYTGKTFVTSSDAFAAFETVALLSFRSQKPPHFQPLTGDLRADYLFRLKGGLTIDVDNAMASINDILQKAGIIVNDDQITKGGFEKVRGCADWYTEVTLTELGTTTT